jgi:hypothetical protein
MKTIGFIILLLFLHVDCTSHKQGKTRTNIYKYSDSIDYCNELTRLGKLRNITDKTCKDSIRVYDVAMANCLMEKIVHHNNDSLTIDTCLCRKRLENALTVDYDSAIISFKNDKYRKIKVVSVRSKNPNILDGIQTYEIDDSCRILGLNNNKKRNNVEN